MQQRQHAPLECVDEHASQLLEWEPNFLAVVARDFQWQVQDASVAFNYPGVDLCHRLHKLVHFIQVID